MRILLIGNQGQLGWELERSLAPLGEIQAIDFPSIDLANVENTRQMVRSYKPDLLINAAAYTAVDQAESELEAASAINATAPGFMAEECARLGAAFIHYSTDYVFDGLKGSPYIESDPPNPLSVYGRTKMDGETRVQQVGGAYLVLRTSWVYSMRRESFISKVLGWSRNQFQIKLVTDQLSSPTWARMLAEATSLLISSGGKHVYGFLMERHGLYHLAGLGYCSRFEWGKEILRLDPHKEEQLVQELLPALTSDFPTPAQRPLFSALNCDLFCQTFNLQLPTWESALKLAMEPG